MWNPFRRKEETKQLINTVQKLVKVDEENRKQLAALTEKETQLQIKIVTEGKQWEKEDIINMKTFLSSPTGRKLLDNLHYTTYEYVMRGEGMTEFRCGIVTGFTMLINSLISGAEDRKIPEPLAPNEEEEEPGAPGLYDQV